MTDTVLSLRRVPHASPPTNGSSGNLPPIATGNSSAPTPGAQDGQGGVSPSALNGQGGVGVGISPAATSEAVEVPGGSGHARRSRER